MMPRRSKLLCAVGALVLFTGLWAVCLRGNARADKDAYRIATVTRENFIKTVRRGGTLTPIKEQHIIGKLWGTIVDIAPQGKLVQKDEVVLRLDATPHEDARIGHESWMAQYQAEYKKQQQESAKTLNQARQDIASYELRVELEQLRLDEIKKGPTATDVINAQTNLANSKNLLVAAEEELTAISELAAQGFTSKEELRQKQLAVQEQRLSVTQAEIAYKKLFVPDPVKIADQQLKLQDATKTRDAAKEKVALMERNIQRDDDNFKRRIQRETKRLNDLIENIEKTVHKAPAAGIVVHKRPRWYPYAPGRHVHDGWEVMGLPDFTTMKVTLTVDEARIANVALGQKARIMPAGWTGEPFKGKVTKVADKGRDEFELYAEDTTSITGTANRQVFDVEIEIEGQSAIFRPGLRAQVDIIIKELENVLVVPRAAIFKDKASTFVRVSAPYGPERRDVKIVAENDLKAVVEGLEQNQQVYVVDEVK